MFELAKKTCGVGGPPTRSGVNSIAVPFWVELGCSTRNLGVDLLLSTFHDWVVFVSALGAACVAATCLYA